MVTVLARSLEVRHRLEGGGGRDDADATPRRRRRRTSPQPQTPSSRPAPPLAGSVAALRRPGVSFDALVGSFTRREGKSSGGIVERAPARADETPSPLPHRRKAARPEQHARHITAHTHVRFSPSIQFLLPDIQHDPLDRQGLWPLPPLVFKQPRARGARREKALSKRCPLKKVPPAMSGRPGTRGMEVRAACALQNPPERPARPCSSGAGLAGRGAIARKKRGRERGRGREKGGVESRPLRRIPPPRANPRAPAPPAGRPVTP
jgi:hypothetical protein